MRAHLIRIGTLAVGLLVVAGCVRTARYSDAGPGGGWSRRRLLDSGAIGTVFKAARVHAMVV